MVTQPLVDARVLTTFDVAETLQSRCGAVVTRRVGSYYTARIVLRAVLPWVGLSLYAACSDTDGLGTRAAQMRAIFIDEDRELASARPSLVENKYATMASGPYPFLRGSEGLFYADATAFTGAPAVVDTSGANLVPLFGDMHLENFGVAPAAMPIIEATDFDASLEGPFDWELRRAAEGLAVLDLVRATHDASEPSASIGAFLDGYIAGVTDATRGDAGPLDRASVGTILAKQLANADEAIAGNTELESDTALASGGRRILRTDELVDVVTPWDQNLSTALRAWSQTRRGGPLAPSQLVVKDIAQRLGAGVSSLALWRFYVLLENGPGDDDDLLLEVKEERDPPAPSSLLGRGAIIEGAYPGEPIPDNAARVIAGATKLLASQDAEPDFGRMVWNNVAFLVRTETGVRINLSSAKLAANLDSGKTVAADLDDMARALGRMVGRAHAHAQPTAAAPILRALDPAARQRIIDRGLADSAQLSSDLSLFRALLAEHGPLLGPPELSY